MNRIGKELTAALLAACLLLGLTACGEKDSGGDSQQLSGTVYVPTFAEITSSAEYIYQGCASNEAFYFLGNIQGEGHEETSTWYDENGMEHVETYTNYDYRTGLFRAPLTGGEAVELENFQSPQLPEGAEGSVDIYGLRAGADGTLWLNVQMYTYVYDLPDDFDEETGNKWDYMTGEENTRSLYHLDSTGNLLGVQDLTDLQEKAGLDYTYSTVIDDAGNIYANSDTKLAVLDPEMNVLFTLEGERMWGDLILLGNGSVGMRNSYYDEERQTSGSQMRVVDLEAKDWGATYELSQDAYNIYPGGGDYLFYYNNGDSIYGYKADGSGGEKIFSWIASDINQNNVEFFAFLPDGRVGAMTRDWNNDSRTYEAAILTPTDASTLPQKTTLTFACMGVNWDVRTKIINFNKTSDLYRIEVIDYSEYNTGEDASAGLTKMNTEILAGHVPDILDASYGSLPISQYAARGLLEDLWPFIEADGEIGGRAGVMENVLKAAEENGKLYQVFSLFDIRSVVGASQIVGDRLTWTLADLKNALAQMPDGCTIFGNTDTKDGMLSSILSCNMDSFVDWSTGECYFDSDSFKSLLEFCNSFPAEFIWADVNWDEWEEEDQRVMSGKQMLQACYINQFTSPARYKAVFGGDVSFVGYPMEDGSVGSSFSISSSAFSMSATSKAKEGVWSFIRDTLVSHCDEEDYYAYDFPVNKKDFDKYIETSMTQEYWEDENGQPQIDEETGEPVKISKDSVRMPDGEWIEIYAATQEEVDQVMELYNSISSVWRYDNSIYSIIQENTGAYFAGDRTVDDTATRIQSAVKLYIGEQS